MQDLVCLSYSVYDRNLKIKINNNPVSQFSPLKQFMNEPLYRWVEDIFQYIDSEIEGRYELEFIGRREEYDAVSFCASKHSFCIHTIFKEFPANSMILQKRLSNLNACIKDNIPTAFPQNKIDATFFFAVSAKEHEPLIKQLDITNRFCKVLPHTQVISSSEFEIPANGCSFVISKNIDFINEIITRSSVSDYCFAIILGKTNRLIDVKNGFFLYEAASDDIFTTIFSCFMLFPLAELFVDTCEYLLSNYKFSKMHKSVLELLSSDVKVTVELQDSVEVNTNMSVKINVLPNSEKPPKLTYICSPDGIVECTQLSIKGISVGETEIQVFAEGDSRPILTKRVNVFKRNRIKSIILSENNVYMGRGDSLKIKMSFVPDDADNANVISWTTDNPSTATVSNKGIINGLNEGHCKITCSAEKVYAECDVFVRPYLSDISIAPEVPNDGLVLQPNIKIKLKCSPIPSNAIDGELLYSSSDTFVANIIEGELAAREIGQAVITVQNKSGSVKKKIALTVASPLSNKQKKKGKGLFGLFKKK